MLREYEFTIITKSDLPDEERTKVLSRYEKLIMGKNGEILKKDAWGSKKLAFPMKKQFRGFYTYYDFVSEEPAELKEAERLLRIDENVLRYLLIKTSDRVDPEARKVELAKPVVPMTH